MRRNRWAGLIVRLTSTAAVSAVGFSLLAAPIPAVAQVGGKTAARPVANSSSGFARTVQHLMDKARKEAAAGNLDAAIQTALRAKKIAEAAATTLGASPDCSPEAADQLYRDLLVQRPAAPAPQTVVEVTAPSPVPKAPVISAPARAVASSDVEKWRPQSARPKATPIGDSDASRSESPPVKPVLLKRTLTADAPIATELGLQSSMAIVGGDRSPNESEPRNILPLEDVPVVARNEVEPEWARDVSSDLAIPEITEEQPRPVTSAPTSSPQPRRMDVSEWSSVGAVAPRQRLARVDDLRNDGWQSPAGHHQAVTRAGGVSERAETVADAVSPTAYHRKPEVATLADAATPIVEKEAAAAPAPPMELDEIDVALHSPSVWVRDTTPVLAPSVPKQDEAATVWQTFSNWTKQRGWTATSAAMGFAAAVLAVMACVLALIPRRNEQA